MVSNPKQRNFLEDRRITQEEEILTQIRRKKLDYWISHTLRKQREIATRQALIWSLQEKRKRGKKNKELEKVELGEKELRQARAVEFMNNNYVQNNVTSETFCT